MISQNAPCRALRNWSYDEGEGFYVDGKDIDDCLEQLREWSMDHPTKWIFYYPVGMKPGYPVPVARYIIEVIFLSYHEINPYGLMPFWRLFRKGELNDE